MRKHLLTLALMLCLLLVGPAFAGTNAQISGTVTDANGNPLELAEIKLVGTDIMIQTDEDGYFSRTDIPPGTYSVKCTYEGYQGKVVEGVIFISDVRRTLNFTLDPLTDVEQTDIVVEVDVRRRLIENDVTSKIRRIGEEDIEKLPADNFYDLMENEAGTVNDDGYMHVRGGRATEITYMVDDMPIVDPISGYAATGINNISIAEMTIISGAFNAEYGNAQSAVINIVTKHGSTDRWEGTLRGRMEVFQTTKEIESQKILASTGEPDPDSVPVTWTTRTRRANFWKAEGAFGGPIGNFMTLFLSGDYYVNGGQLPKDEPREEYNAQGKIRMAFAGDQARPEYNNMFFIASGTLSQMTRQLWDCQWQYTLDNYIYQARDTYQVTGLWRHLVSDKTWYTVRANYYNTWVHAGIKWGEDDWHYEGTDDGGVEKVWNNGDAWEEHEVGGWKWWEDYDLNRTQTGPDGWFYTTGDMRWYENTYEDILTGKADMQTELDKHNLVKAGLEYKYYDVEYFQRQPLPNNVYGDGYHVFPWQGAAYVQDKMDYSEMVINLGLRFDYFDPNTDYAENPMNYQGKDSDSEYANWDDVPRVEADPKYQLSPRLGVAHPITEFDKIHFSYGHFFQMPVFRFLYMGNYEEPTGSFPIFGNPDLKPEKTISYEVGVQHVFKLGVSETNPRGQSILLDVTGFYKDISNQIDTIMYTHPLGIYNYTRTTNADWGNVRGVEVVLDGSWTDWFSSKISYTYSIARGLSSDWRQGYEYSYNGWNLPLEANLLDWDVTHTINVMLDFRQGPFGVNINANLGSGTPYSPPIEEGGQQEINTKRMPWLINLDAKATYDLELWGLNFGLFVEAFNLFDRWNVTNFGSNEGSGSGSDWTYYYENYEDENGPWDDMEVYGEPLQIRVGASISF